MPTAVQLDEKSMVRTIIEAQELPPGVKFKRVEDYADWEGKPAFRIYFTTSKALGISPKRIKALSRLSLAVELAVLRSGTDKFPYVSFLEVK